MSRRVRRLLGTTAWDADALRDDARGWLIRQLGHPRRVLVSDGTGFLKKGARSAGACATRGARRAAPGHPGAALVRVGGPGWQMEAGLIAVRGR
ncbi:hypothetical protein [Micromonospora chersina]|uniref:hypothetical protein n=1 Tax=Micromonospora chersina TaxID=47854 RepID=UPI003F53F493